MSTAGRRLLPDRLWLPYTLFVAGFAVYLIHCAATEWIPEFTYTDDYQQLGVRIREPFPAYLLAPHNGHVIPATRLILHADYDALGGRGVLPYGAALSFLGVSAVILLALLRNRGTADLPLRRTLAGFVCFGLLWAAGFYGLFWGFSVHAPMTVATLLAAVFCLVVYSERPGSRRRSGWLALTAAAAIATTLGCATGVAVWGSLVAVALLARLPLRTTASLVLGAALSIALLASLSGGRDTSSVGAAGLVLSQTLTLSLVPFVLAYLAVPVANLLEGLLGPIPWLRDTLSVWVAGAAVIASAVFALQRLRRARRPGPVDLLAISLMAFSLGAALLTALARSEGFTGSHYRFTYWAMPFWIGGAAALVSSAERRGAGRLRLALLVGIPCLSVAMLPGFERHHDGVRQEERHRAALADLMILVGITDEHDRVDVGLGSKDVMQAVLAKLEHDGRGPFADPRRALLGKNLADLGPASGAEHCRGKVHRVKPIVTPSGVAARVDGTAFGADAAHPPRFVLVADRTGAVRGLGNMLPRGGRRIPTWYAYVAPGPQQQYTAVAALEDGSFCRLGGFRVSRAATIDAPRDEEAPPARSDRS